jgi:thioredoxin-dependent peroxiredoxin
MKKLVHPLVIGEKAPDFALENLAGETVHLAQFAGKKVLLSFLRNAECAICNLWVATTTKRAPDWRAHGLEVIAVFESSVEKLRTQFEGRLPPFQVLADPDGSVHDTFGSRTDPERVQAIIASGAADAALVRAAAAGFLPRREAGANFFRLPAEILLEKDGRLVAVQVAEGVADHLDSDVVTRFAAAG